MVASVYIVPHEQIVGVRTISTYPEELKEVLKLTMDVSADCHWAFHVLNVLLSLHK